jgi:hypothetical protein
MFKNLMPCYSLLSFLTLDIVISKSAAAYITEARRGKKMRTEKLIMGAQG